MKYTFSFKHGDKVYLFDNEDNTLPGIITDCWLEPEDTLSKELEIDLQECYDVLIKEESGNLKSYSVSASKIIPR